MNLTVSSWNKSHAMNEKFTSIQLRCLIKNECEKFIQGEKRKGEREEKSLDSIHTEKSSFTSLSHIFINEQCEKSMEEPSKEEWWGAGNIETFVLSRLAYFSLSLSHSCQRSSLLSFKPEFSFREIFSRSFSFSHSLASLFLSLFQEFPFLFS